VSTLQDAAGKLTSVTGWNGVSTTSSDSKYVSATAVGGTLPTTFSVEVQGLAKAQATASAALLPVGGALGAGTLRLELGQWSVAPASFTPSSGQPVDISITASDKLSDVASKINGANAGVTASILTDASGERLLLRSKSTGEEFGFRLSVMETGDTDPRVQVTPMPRACRAWSMALQSRKRRLMPRPQSTGSQYRRRPTRFLPLSRV